jgi:ELWxxDGT repeat protein
VGPAYAYLLTESGGRLYFLAYDGPASSFTDVGLWKSDGTAKGTVLVRKFSTDSTIAIPFNLAGLDGDVLFELDYFDGRPQVSELWRSDGTPAGTVLVKTLAFPTGPQFTVADGTLYFAADDGVSGTELWRTDGTTAGTRTVKDLFPGGTSYGANGEWWAANSSSPTALAAMGGKLYFYALDETGGALWRSDGTARGTVKVRNLVSGPDLSSPRPLTAIGRTLYFSDDDGLTGREPWRSDGTARGTVRLADVAPGAGSSGPSGFAISGSSLFFAADGTTTGRELWAIPLSQR